MRKIGFLLILLTLVTNLFAQVIYTEPEFATADDSIVVYFDATQAENQSLVGYTGDLYTHTGLNTSAGTWQHVIESWGDNDTQPKLERIDTDLYKLTIGYPREFYDVSDESEEILGMNFVFRSADASQQTEDLFYTFFTSGITTVIDSPAVDVDYGDMKRSPLFYRVNDEIAFNIKVATLGSAIESILIFKDNSLVQSSEGENELKYSEIANTVGTYDYEIIAKDTDGLTDTTWFNAIVFGEEELISLPDGVEPGINYMDDGSIILALFAPYKNFVYLIGNFNDWYVDNDYLMNKDIISEDSIMYWYQFNSITENQVYQFQYLIDGELRIADPYTEVLLDPLNDSYIDESVFPDLPEYPEGKTSYLVSTFEKKSSEFEWTDNNYETPAKEKLVIYELLIRDFTEEHTYASTMEKLDYLEELGVNAIELLPTNEFEGNSSWGYNPSFYFAVDKYYGTPDDLKNFVNECHNRGIAVFGDMVLNHAFGTNSMVRMYQNSSSEVTDENPWFNITAPHTDYYWGYDFNHASDHTKYFVDRVNQYWIDEFHFDGYRFDFTRGFTNKAGGSGPYDASRIKILKRMADKIWDADSNAFVIIEHLVDENSGEMEELADYGMLLWGNMNHAYNQASMGWSTSWDFSWGYYKNRGWSKPNLITYMESHDEERLMYKNVEYGNSSGDYSIKHPYTALQRQKLVNAFFLTFPGPKMIWQFGEIGYDYSIDYNGRTGEKPLVWDYLVDENRMNLYKTIQALIKIRTENDVFTSKNTSVTQDLSGAVKQLKLSGSSNVHIIGNFGVTSQTVSMNFVHGGKWYDYFANDSLNISSNVEITLEPGEFHVYSDESFGSVESDLLVGVEEEIVAEEFSLGAPYPNPFNPQTTIPFYLPDNGKVDIKVYNMLGELVHVKTIAGMKKGYHRYTWNVNMNESISSGVYFIKLSFNGFSENSKVLLIK